MSLQFLTKHNVGSLCEEERPIYTVGKNASIKEIFETLIQHKILSIPVYDNRAGKYKTFIDMLDILVYAVRVIGNNALKAGYETFSSHDEFVATCAELADASKRNPFIAVDKSMSIAKVIERLNSSKVHRVAAVDSAGELQDLISQSAVVKFIHQHIDEVPSAKKTVEELKLGYREVITVPLSQTCFSAFQTIVDNKISGLGIVDGDGKLIANLSASDIKKLGYDNYLLSNVFLTMDKFLVLGREGEEIPPVISVKPTDTLEQVVENFVTKKVHRLYVLDDDNNMKGVITLGDVLSLF